MRRQVKNGHPLPSGWAGTWGPLGDARSKLGRLAKRIEGELLVQYPPRTPLDRRRISRAARLTALAEATGSSIGTDAKATPRRLVSLEAAADRAIAPLEAAHNGHSAPSTPATILASMRRASDG